MKKAIMFFMCSIIVFMGFSINKTYAYSYYASWSNYGDYASVLNIDVDDDEWNLYSWLYREVTTPTSTYGGSSNDMGNIKMWVGIYHTDAIESSQRDTFLVIYKVNTVPQTNYNSEKGYTHWLEVTSNIDQLKPSGEEYSLVSYAPESVNEGESYVLTFGTTLSYTQGAIYAYDMEVDADVSDPYFSVKYEYDDDKDNDYADDEHSHYGYMVIDVPAADGLDIQINFTALFSDFDWFLSKDTSTISCDFFFGS